MCCKKNQKKFDHTYNGADKISCPLRGQCLTECILYKATVTFVAQLKITCVESMKGRFKNDIIITTHFNLESVNIPHHCLVISGS